MSLFSDFLDPKTTIILQLAFSKAKQRLPLSTSIVISTALFTYVTNFNYEMGFTGISFSLFVFLVAIVITVFSFALEYDTVDELKMFINIGVSPSDIFTLGISRVLLLSMTGYFIGILFMVAYPITVIENYKVFYTFLFCLAFGILPPMYSSLKSLRISLLGKQSFKPIIEKEIPSILSIEEMDELKEFIEWKIIEVPELLPIGITVSKENRPEMEVVCRYIGDAGREATVMLSTVGLSATEALKNDETLPLAIVKLTLRPKGYPLMECMEVKKGKKMTNTYIANSLGAWIRQQVIEYKVYKGKRRALH
uniref:Uncharacterized protein n=1 Tax=Candidatus Methanomethylicus mesodigestus TaxID=1867258 RepID=A0A7C3EW30_9CREN